MNDYAKFEDQGNTSADKLLAGNFPRVVKQVTVIGGNYAKGTVLGKITTSGKYTIVTSAATDGSKVPEAILAEDVNASTDAEAIVYLTGEFNQSALAVGAGLTVVGIINDCRNKSLFFKTNQS